MSDLIKREDAIEAIVNTYCKPCKEQGNDYNEAKCRACNFDDAILEIRDVPSAEAVPCEIADKVGEENERLTDRIGQLEEQMRWIPVSERLPEVTDTVLVQDGCGDIETAQVCTHYDGSLVFDGEWEYELEEVVAWMPLPTPYKESEVEE